MLDPKDCEVTMPNKISFSIIDILDPKKFNSRRVNELSVAKEKCPAQRADLLDCDRTAGGDVERADAGRCKTHKANEIVLFYFLLVFAAMPSEFQFVSRTK